MWLSCDGSFKVEVISTADKGQYLTIWVWASQAREWILAADIQPPLGLTNSERASYLITAMSRYLDLADLDEFPDGDDWEGEAFRCKGSENNGTA
jgi:hypothetical protein